MYYEGALERKHRISLAARGSYYPEGEISTLSILSMLLSIGYWRREPVPTRVFTSLFSRNKAALCRVKVSI